MYQRFFIVIFSLFVLTLVAFIQSVDSRPRNASCGERLLPITSRGGVPALVHETINCKK
jgi:hypothetical protein